MENESINDRIRAIASDVARQMGLEFVHAEIVGTKRNLTVRIFIDKPGGVTIEDCSNASREIEALLDADDFIPTAYVLEVSSPGLDRQLYSLDDFRRFTGELAKVKVENEIDGQRNFTGTITAVEDETVIFEDATKGEVRIPYSQVSKANLKVDLGKELNRRASPR